MKKEAAKFRKSERLCGIKRVSNLFATGRSLTVPSIRVIFLITPADPSAMPVRVLITVPRRHFRRAVDRNLIRRRIREAWRKNKEPLLTVMRDNGKHADIALVWTDTAIRSWDHTEKSVQEAIRRVAGLK